MGVDGETIVLIALRSLLRTAYSYRQAPEQSHVIPEGEFSGCRWNGQRAVSYLQSD